MSLQNHIKEHQTLWGIIIGVVGIGLISTVLAIRIVFFQDSSSRSPATTSQPTIRDEPQYQETSTEPTYTENVQVGTITNISEGRSITVEPISSSKDPQTFTVPKSATITLLQHAQRPTESQKSELSFTDLRKGDKINLYFGSDENTSKIIRLKIDSTTFNSNVREPQQFNP